MVNNSQTGSSSHDPLRRSRSEIGLELALAILICLISFLDNFLVVYVVHKDSRLNSVFIQNLALTDISMATLHMPFWVISLYTGTWIFSERLCEIQAVINCTLGVASILNMGLMAFNRYSPDFSRARERHDSTAPWYGWLLCFLQHRHYTAGAIWPTILSLLSALLIGQQGILHWPWLL